MTTPIKIAILTMSDTRTLEDDESGRVLGEILSGAGFFVRSRAVLREELDTLRANVHELCDRSEVDAIIINGGTGIGPRDRTIEAIEPMFQKKLDGFGDAFRRLSWEEIGPHAILSRAVAGIIGGRFVAALPGSPKAVRLGAERLLVPTLEHAVALLAGRTAHPKSHAKHDDKHAKHDDKHAKHDDKHAKHDAHEGGKAGAGAGRKERRG
jgi:molybdopterin adenylyltransferase